MKIETIALKKLEMPYTKPLVTATNNFTVARGLLVTVVTQGGVEGYGYADLFPRAGETAETAQHVIESVWIAKVVGNELEDLGRIRADIDRALTGHPRAKSALESAMIDALARSYHIPLYVMLGGKYRNEIKVVKMVSVGSPEAMAQEAKELVAAGLSLKLKVSGRIDQDLPRVAAVRQAVGDGVFIKIDANEAYDAKTAIRLAKGLADLGRSHRGNSSALRALFMSGERGRPARRFWRLAENILARRKVREGGAPSPAGEAPALPRRRIATALPNELLFIFVEFRFNGGLDFFVEGGVVF
jgi:L-alanine-DL-glutamate epimerase-like enolase superfamily enzyme